MYPAYIYIYMYKFILCIYYNAEKSSSEFGLTKTAATSIIALETVLISFFMSCVFTQRPTSTPSP